MGTQSPISLVEMVTGPRFYSGSIRWMKSRKPAKCQNGAILFPHHAMGVGAYGHFVEKPPATWKNFVDILRTRLMLSNVETRLLSELNLLRMTGDNFNRYLSQFQAYRQHLPTIDRKALM